MEFERNEVFMWLGAVLCITDSNGCCDNEVRGSAGVRGDETQATGSKAGLADDDHVGMF